MDSVGNKTGRNASGCIRPSAECELSVSDMISWCLSHWKSAVIVVIIAAFLFGAAKGTMSFVSSSVIAAKISSESALTENEPADGKLTEYRNMLVRKEYLTKAISGLNDQIASRKAYLENSVYMKIDPEKESLSSAEIVIYLPRNSKDNSLLSLFKAYEDRIMNGSCLNELAKATGIEAAYIKELVTVENSGYETSLTTNWTSRASTEGTASESVGVIVIKAVAPDSDLSGRIIKTIGDNLPAITEDLKKIVADHSTAFSSQPSAVVYDQNVSDKKTARTKELVDFQTQLEKYQNEIKQIKAYDVSGFSSRMSMAFKAAVKYAVIGAVFGLVVYMVFLALRYMLSCKILTRAHLDSRFDIRSLDGGCKDGEKKIGMIAAGLSVNEEGKNFVICSLGSKNAASVAEKLTKELPGKTFSAAEDLIGDPKDRLLLKDADAVIFMGAYKVTAFAEVEQAVRIAEDSGVRVAGFIAD